MLLLYQQNLCMPKLDKDPFFYCIVLKVSVLTKLLTLYNYLCLFKYLNFKIVVVIKACLNPEGCVVPWQENIWNLNNHVIIIFSLPFTLIFVGKILTLVLLYSIWLDKLLMITKFESRRISIPLVWLLTKSSLLRSIWASPDPCTEKGHKLGLFVLKQVMCLCYLISSTISNAAYLNHFLL
jgi:hypothetical protein